MAAVLGGTNDIQREEDGNNFIDRNRTHFRYILNYLVGRWLQGRRITLCPRQNTASSVDCRLYCKVLTCVSMTSSRHRVPKCVPFQSLYLRNNWTHTSISYLITGHFLSHILHNSNLNVHNHENEPYFLNNPDIQNFSWEMRCRFSLTYGKQTPFYGKVIINTPLFKGW